MHKTVQSKHLALFTFLGVSKCLKSHFKYIKLSDYITVSV